MEGEGGGRGSVHRLIDRPDSTSAAGQTCHSADNTDLAHMIADCMLCGLHVTLIKRTNICNECYVNGALFFHKSVEDEEWLKEVHWLRQPDSTNYYVYYVNMDPDMALRVYKTVKKSCKFLSDENNDLHEQMKVILTISRMIENRVPIKPHAPEEDTGMAQCDVCSENLGLAQVVGMELRRCTGCFHYYSLPFEHDNSVVLKLALARGWRNERNQDNTLTARLAIDYVPAKLRAHAQKSLITEMESAQNKVKQISVYLYELMRAMQLLRSIM
jgi:hypothetical protein